VAFTGQDVAVYANGKLRCKAHAPTQTRKRLFARTEEELEDHVPPSTPVFERQKSTEIQNLEELLATCNLSAVQPKLKANGYRTLEDVFGMKAEETERMALKIGLDEDQTVAFALAVHRMRREHERLEGKKEKTRYVLESGPLERNCDRRLTLVSGFEGAVSNVGVWYFALNHSQVRCAQEDLKYVSQDAELMVAQKRELQDLTPDLDGPKALFFDEKQPLKLPDALGAVSTVPEALEVFNLRSLIKSVVDQGITLPRLIAMVHSAHCRHLVEGAERPERTDSALYRVYEETSVVIASKHVDFRMVPPHNFPEIVEVSDIAAEAGLKEKDVVVMVNGELATRATLRENDGPEKPVLLTIHRPADRKGCRRKLVLDDDQEAGECRSVQGTTANLTASAASGNNTEESVVKEFDEKQKGSDSKRKRVQLPWEASAEALSQLLREAEPTVVSIVAHLDAHRLRDRKAEQGSRDAFERALDDGGDRDGVGRKDSNVLSSVKLIRSFVGPYLEAMTFVLRDGQERSTTDRPPKNVATRFVLEKGEYIVRITGLQGTHGLAKHITLHTNTGRERHLTGTMHSRSVRSPPESPPTSDKFDFKAKDGHEVVGLKLDKKLSRPRVVGITEWPLHPSAKGATAVDKASKPRKMGVCIQYDKPGSLRTVERSLWRPSDVAVNTTGSLSQYSVLLDVFLSEAGHTSPVSFLVPDPGAPFSFGGMRAAELHKRFKGIPGSMEVCVKLSPQPRPGECLRKYTWSSSSGMLGWRVLGGSALFTYANGGGDAQIAGIMPSPYVLRDSVHPPVCVRSPTFFNPTRIRFRIKGGRGNAVRPGEPGFLGVALRRVVNGAYSKWFCRQASDPSTRYEEVEWVLPPGATGEYTLDIIDACEGAHITVNDVEISAEPEATGGPLLAGTPDGRHWYRWQVTKHGEPEVIVFEADSHGQAQAMSIYTAQGVNVCTGEWEHLQFVHHNHSHLHTNAKGFVSPMMISAYLNGRLVRDITPKRIFATHEPLWGRGRAAAAMGLSGLLKSCGMESYLEALSSEQVASLEKAIDLSKTEGVKLLVSSGIQKAKALTILDAATRSSASVLTSSASQIAVAIVTPGDRVMVKTSGYKNNTCFIEGRAVEMLHEDGGWKLRVRAPCEAKETKTLTFPPVDDEYYLAPKRPLTPNKGMRVMAPFVDDVTPDRWAWFAGSVTNWEDGVATIAFDDGAEHKIAYPSPHKSRLATDSTVVVAGVGKKDGKLDFDFVKGLGVEPLESPMIVLPPHCPVEAGDRAIVRQVAPPASDDEDGKKVDGNEFYIDGRVTEVYPTEDEDKWLLQIAAPPDAAETRLYEFPPANEEYVLTPRETMAPTVGARVAAPRVEEDSPNKWAWVMGRVTQLDNDEVTIQFERKSEKKTVSMHYPSPYQSNLDPSKGPSSGGLTQVLVHQFEVSPIHSPMIVLSDAVTNATSDGSITTTPRHLVPDVSLCSNFRLRGISSHGYPLNTAYRNLEHQSIYLASELRACGIVAQSAITGLSIKASNPPGCNLENVRVACAWVTKSEFSNSDERCVDTKVMYGPDDLPEGLFSGALFHKDEKVKAKWHGGRTYSAVIKGINRDGTYQVKYNDGDFDMSVNEKDILLPNGERKVATKSDQWVRFEFSTPLICPEANQNLLVEFTMQSSTSGGGGGVYCRETNRQRALFAFSEEADDRPYGYPFEWRSIKYNRSPLVLDVKLHVNREQRPRTLAGELMGVCERIPKSSSSRRAGVRADPPHLSRRPCIPARCGFIGTDLFSPCFSGSMKQLRLFEMEHNPSEQKQKKLEERAGRRSAEEAILDVPFDDGLASPTLKDLATTEHKITVMRYAEAAEEGLMHVLGSGQVRLLGHLTPLIAPHRRWFRLGIEVEPTRVTVSIDNNKFTLSSESLPKSQITALKLARTFALMGPAGKGSCRTYVHAAQLLNLVGAEKDPFQPLNINHFPEEQYLPSLTAIGNGCSRVIALKVLQRNRFDIPSAANDLLLNWHQLKIEERVRQVVRRSKHLTSIGLPEALCVAAGKRALSEIDVELPLGQTWHNMLSAIFDKFPSFTLGGGGVTSSPKTGGFGSALLLPGAGTKSLSLLSELDRLASTHIQSHHANGMYGSPIKALKPKSKKDRDVTTDRKRPRTADSAGGEDNGHLKVRVQRFWQEDIEGQEGEGAVPTSPQSSFAMSSGSEDAWGLDDEDDAEGVVVTRKELRELVKLQQSLQQAEPKEQNAPMTRREDIADQDSPLYGPDTWTPPPAEVHSFLNVPRLNKLTRTEAFRLARAQLVRTRPAVERALGVMYARESVVALLHSMPYEEFEHKSGDAKDWLVKFLRVIEFSHLPGAMDELRPWLIEKIIQDAKNLRKLYPGSSKGAHREPSLAEMAKAAPFVCMLVKELIFQLLMICERGRGRPAETEKEVLDGSAPSPGMAFWLIDIFVELLKQVLDRHDTSQPLLYLRGFVFCKPVMNLLMACIVRGHPKYHLTLLRVASTTVAANSDASLRRSGVPPVTITNAYQDLLMRYMLLLHQRIKPKYSPFFKSLLQLNLSLDQLKRMLDTPVHFTDSKLSLHAPEKAPGGDEKVPASASPLLLARPSVTDEDIISDESEEENEDLDEEKNKHGPSSPSGGGSGLVSGSTAVSSRWFKDLVNMLRLLSSVEPEGAGRTRARKPAAFARTVFRPFLDKKIASPENAAYGKLAWQSSTELPPSHLKHLSPNRTLYGASRAVDGYIKGDFLTASCTGWEKDPWWQVDLGADTDVETVTIWPMHRSGTLRRTMTSVAEDGGEVKMREENAGGGDGAVYLMGFRDSEDLDFEDIKSLGEARKHAVFCHELRAEELKGTTTIDVGALMCGDANPSMLSVLTESGCREYVRALQGANVSGHALVRLRDAEFAELLDVVNMSANHAERLYEEIRRWQRCQVRYLRVQRLGEGSLSLTQISVRAKSEQSVPKKAEEKKVDVIPPVAVGDRVFVKSTGYRKNTCYVESECISCNPVGSPGSGRWELIVRSPRSSPEEKKFAYPPLAGEYMLEPPEALIPKVGIRVVAPFGDHNTPDRWAWYAGKVRSWAGGVAMVDFDDGTKWQIRYPSVHQDKLDIRKNLLTRSFVQGLEPINLPLIVIPLDMPFPPNGASKSSSDGSSSKPKLPVSRASVETFQLLDSAFTNAAVQGVVEMVNRWARENNASPLPDGPSAGWILNLQSAALRGCAEITSLGLNRPHIDVQISKLQEMTRMVMDTLPYTDLSLPMGFSSLADGIRKIRTWLLTHPKVALLTSHLQKSMHSTAANRPKYVGEAVDLDVLAAGNVTLKRQTDHKARRTVFGQLYQQLKHRSVDRVFKIGPNHRAFKANYVGMNAIDAGGPYRDAIETLCREVQSPALPLFVRTPNGRMDAGRNRDSFVPRTSSKGLLHQALYEFLGRFFGLAIRTRFLLSFNFPSILWKPLVGSTVNDADVKAIDKTALNAIEPIQALIAQGVKQEDFDAQFKPITFTFCQCDGKVVPLVKGGNRMSVTSANYKQFIDKLRQARLEEFSFHCRAIRRGLGQVVPLATLSLFTWKELEMLVCGQGVTKKQMPSLKRMTAYSGCNASDQHVKHFWKMMEDVFDDSQRAKFISFTWGRSRLPQSEKDYEQKFKIASHNASEASDDPDSFFPLAHTCFFQIDLPRYSSVEAMTRRVLWAMESCATIDEDSYSSTTGPHLQDLADDEAGESYWDEGF